MKTTRPTESPVGSALPYIGKDDVSDDECYKFRLRKQFGWFWFIKHMVLPGIELCKQWLSEGSQRSL